MLEVNVDESRPPGGSLRGAIESLERLHWYLYTKDVNGRVYLFRGDRPIFVADSRDAVDAFILGASLAYCSLPEPLFTQYEDYLAKIATWPTNRPSIPGLTPVQASLGK